jgi:ABC-type glycerol-3-phosphate transport system substrate-binding protein
MIHKCIALFNLLPTSQPHYWLIAADWLEEEGLDVTAATFRENAFILEIIDKNANGYGNFIGSSNSNFSGSGVGDGWGWGYGRGGSEYDGTGYGRGYGRGEYNGMGAGE